MEMSKKVILYHFTGRKAADRIKHEGITLGRTPIITADRKLAFLKNTQWLTIYGEAGAQTWATRGRNQAMVKVNIPLPLAQQKLVPFQIFYDHFKDILPKGFNDRPDITVYWYVYMGVIPKEWIVSVRRTGV